MPCRLTLGVFLSGISFCWAALGGEWPGWRGPHQNGAANKGDFPLHWNQVDNVLWRAPLLGQSGSTPAVWQDHIFVSADSESENWLLCFDPDGQVRWRKNIGTARPPKESRGPSESGEKASGSHPSPTTDGEHVYAYYRGGTLVCLDFQGQVVWQQNLQERYGDDTLWFDLGTSPLLTANAVIVACVQSGPSYLVAIDKRTGKELWKHDRQLAAPLEAAHTYSSPILVGGDETPTVVVLGADHVTAHDANTGSELWRVGGLNPQQEQYFRSIASPAASGDVVLAPYARGGSLTAIRLGGAGDVTASHVIWRREGAFCDVPTPAARDGRFYICEDKGTIQCLDAETGKEIWAERVEKNRHRFSASPIVTPDCIYVTREDGTVFVLATGDKYELLAKNSLEEKTLATPVLVDGRIYLRTYENLYCIGER